MNPALVVNAMHRVYGNSLRMLVAGLMLLFLVLTSYVGLGAVGWAPWVVWVMGTGLVGTEMSQGSLVLVLTRPVRRWEYVLSKWAGLVLACWAYFALALLVSLAFERGAAFSDLPRVALSFAWSAWCVLTVAGTLTLFSCLAGNHGDVALLVLGWLLAGWIHSYSVQLGQSGWPLASALTETGYRALGEFLIPNAAFQFYSQGTFALRSLLPDLMSLALSLGLASLVMERKELGYGRE